MIEGALIALTGILVGRFLPGRRRTPKEVKATCGCGHARGYHKDYQNSCKWNHENTLGLVTATCGCQHYDGPLPIETYFAQQTLPPHA